MKNHELKIPTGGTCFAHKVYNECLTDHLVVPQEICISELCLTCDLNFLARQIFRAERVINVTYS
jgi:hypothetical protein